MSTIRHHRAAPTAALALALLASGCASRALPPAFPATSAAEPAAPAAPAAHITRALDQDPPLPGDPVSHWPGLAAELHGDDRDARDGGGHAH